MEKLKSKLCALKRPRKEINSANFIIDGLKKLLNWKFIVRQVACDEISLSININLDFYT